MELNFTNKCFASSVFRKCLQGCNTRLDVFGNAVNSSNVFDIYTSYYYVNKIQQSKTLIAESRKKDGNKLKTYVEHNIEIRKHNMTHKSKQTLKKGGGANAQIKKAKRNIGC